MRFRNAKSFSYFHRPQCVSLDTKGLIILKQIRTVVRSIDDAFIMSPRKDSEKEKRKKNERKIKEAEEKVVFSRMATRKLSPMRARAGLRADKT